MSEQSEEIVIECPKCKAHIQAYGPLAIAGKPLLCPDCGQELVRLDDSGRIVYFGKGRDE